VWGRPPIFGQAGRAPDQADTIIEESLRRVFAGSSIPEALGSLRFF